ncbi:MAG TPA: hypothetical protein VKX16_03750 [Chloroflexota bacterium]|nr:hypothetical protein [Chloroflexota bacterium]
MKLSSGIAIIVTALAVSPKARRVAYRGAGAAVSAGVRAAKVVARGTRNLQEESKHVTRFGVEPVGGDAAPGDQASP